MKDFNIDDFRKLSSVEKLSIKCSMLMWLIRYFQRILPENEIEDYLNHLINASKIKPNELIER